jgi:16S rRNA G1207 methylase RsmC
MSDGPVIRSDNQGVAKVLGTVEQIGSAFAKPIKKAMKDKEKQAAKQTAVEQGKKLIKAQGKQQRKNTKTAAKAEAKLAAIKEIYAGKRERKASKTISKQASKLLAKSGTQVKISTVGGSASFTRNSVATPPKNKSKTTTKAPRAPRAPRPQPRGR